MNWQDYSLISSNQKKLEEFRRFGLPLDIKKGEDLDEVDGSPIDVILHKSKDSGAMTVVEDTRLDVEGAAVGVNVRWMLDHLDSYVGRRAAWCVLIGVNDGHSIRLFEGVIHGTIQAASLS